MPKKQRMATLTLAFIISKEFQIPYQEEDEDKQFEAENDFISARTMELEKAGWDVDLASSDVGLPQDYAAPKGKKKPKTRRK
jgi:hypothetical protein